MNPYLESATKWLRRPQGALMAFGAIGLGLLLLLSLGGGRSDGEAYEVLLSDHDDPMELMRLARLLGEKGIPSRIEDGGQQLLVASGRSAEAREMLIEGGLHEEVAEPSGSDFFGFSASFDLSPDAFRQRRVRQKEAELARTISFYPEVRHARVHLNVPEHSNFGRPSEPPSASIFVGLRAHRALAPTLAVTLRTLVSHAVKGLAPEAVLLADNLGTDYEELIRSYGRSSARHQAETQFALLRDAEKRTETKLLAQLGPVFGEDRVTASVSISFCDSEGAAEHLPLMRLEADGTTHLCLSNLAICLDKRVVDGDPLSRVKQTLLESIRTALGLGRTTRVPLCLRILPFARPISDTHLVGASEPSELAAASPAAPVPSPTPMALAPREVAGGEFGLPLGIFFLMVSALGVARTGGRDEPVGLDLACTELPDIDVLREDPTSRRVVAACLSEEDPAFAARVAARLLNDVDGSGFAHEPAGSFLAGLGSRVAPEVLARLPDEEALEALVSVSRVESDAALAYLDPGINVLAWLVIQRALSKQGRQEARRICRQLCGPFGEEDVLSEIDQIWEQPLRRPEEQSETRERLADQLFSRLQESPDAGVALALAIAPRPLARRSLVEFVDAGRDDVALWISCLDSAFPHVLGLPEAGDEILAELLDGLRIEVRSGILERIRQRDPDLWGRLFDRGFSIRELESFGDQDLGALLSRAPAEDLSLVLREAPEMLRRRCLRLLEPGTRSLVGQGLDSKGPVRLRDLEKARERLGAICRELGLRGDQLANV